MFALLLVLLVQAPRSIAMGRQGGGRGGLGGCYWWLVNVGAKLMLLLLPCRSLDSSTIRLELLLCADALLLCEFRLHRVYSTSTTNVCRRVVVISSST